MNMKKMFSILSAVAVCSVPFATMSLNASAGETLTLSVLSVLKITGMLLLMLHQSMVMHNMNILGL